MSKISAQIDIKEPADPIKRIEPVLPRVGDGRYHALNDPRYRQPYTPGYVSPYGVTNPHYANTNVGLINTKFGTKGFPVVQAPIVPILNTPSISAVAKTVETRVAAKPSWVKDTWKTIRLENKVELDGYRYVFETETGILAEEVGRLENKGLFNEGIKAQGYFQFIDETGVLNRFDYESELAPILPKGVNVPKVPPTLEKLMRFLAVQPL